MAFQRLEKSVELGGDGLAARVLEKG